MAERRSRNEQHQPLTGPTGAVRTEPQPAAHRQPKLPAASEPTETLNFAIVLNVASAWQNEFRILAAFEPESRGV